MIEEESLLVERARAGDEAAFGQLLDDALDRMLSVTRRMLRDESEAWDVAQDAAFKAWINVGTFRGDAKFSTWICGIAVRLALDRIRDARPTAELSEHVPCDDSPQGNTENRALAEELEAAVRELSPAERGVFVLHAQEGLRYHEIAGQLGIPTGTVMSRLHAARLKLRERLKHWWMEELQ